MVSDFAPALLGENVFVVRLNSVFSDDDVFHLLPMMHSLIEHYLVFCNIWPRSSICD